MSTSQRQKKVSIVDQPGPPPPLRSRRSSVTNSPAHGLRSGTASPTPLSPRSASTPLFHSQPPSMMLSPVHPPASAVSNPPSDVGLESPSASTAASVAGGDPTNVKVMVRVRPFNTPEIDLSQKDMLRRKAEAEANGEDMTVWESPEYANPLRPVLHVTADHRVTVLEPPKYDAKDAMAFDHVFWSVPSAQFDAGVDPDVPIATQEDVFKAVGVPSTNAVLCGRNSCIFAYGQTGSGKTHTMMGYNTDPGLIPRIVRLLFDLVDNSPEHLEHTVTASFLEIYNEKVKDLLDAAALKTLAKDSAFCDRKVRYTPETGAYVEGLRRTTITSAAECADVIKAGTQYRTTASTKMNDTSSRSHAILQLSVKKVDRHSGFLRRATMNLVDLAGSERIRMSGVSGDQLREARNINLSLTTLRRVIDTLIDNAKLSSRRQGAVVPYRESMLTWVLSESLGGNCETCMLGMASPHERCFEDTLNTLRYCLKAKAITCHVRVNEEKTKVVMGAIRAEMETMKKKEQEAAERAQREAEEMERKKKEHDDNARQAALRQRIRMILSSKTKEDLALRTAELQQLEDELAQRAAMADETKAFASERAELEKRRAQDLAALDDERHETRLVDRRLRKVREQIQTLESKHDHVQQREQIAASMRRDVQQKELARIFRAARDFDREETQTRILVRENKRLQEDTAHLQRLHTRNTRRGASMRETIELMTDHYAGALERERALRAKCTAAAEMKDARMREAKLGATSAQAQIRDAKQQIQRLTTDTENLYRELDQTNGEANTVLRELGTSIAELRADLLRIKHREDQFLDTMAAAEADRRQAERHLMDVEAQVKRLKLDARALLKDERSLSGEVEVLAEECEAAATERSTVEAQAAPREKQYKGQLRMRSRVREAEMDLVAFLFDHSDQIPPSMLELLVVRYPKEARMHFDRLTASANYAEEAANDDAADGGADLLGGTGGSPKSLTLATSDLAASPRGGSGSMPSAIAGSPLHVSTTANTQPRPAKERREAAAAIHKLLERLMSSSTDVGGGEEPLSPTTPVTAGFTRESTATVAPFRPSTGFASRSGSPSASRNPRGGTSAAVTTTTPKNGTRINGTPTAGPRRVAAPSPRRPR